MAKLLECKIRINDEVETTVEIVGKFDEHDYGKYIITEDAKLSIKIRNTIEADKNSFTFGDEKFGIIEYKIIDESYCILKPKLIFDLSNDLMSYDIYYYKARTRCDIHKHNVVSATAIVRTSKFENVPINVDHCLDCNKHYVNKVSLDCYELKYGEIYACKQNQINKSNFNESGTRFYDRRNEQSILANYGYSVSRLRNLSSRQRAKILLRVIEMGAMSKPQIIDHIEYLIKERSDRNNMKTAISKWKEDLRFINNYKMNNQMVVYGTVVDKNKQIMK